MALRDDIRNAMIAAGFDPDDETSATSPKYTARLFEAIAGVVSAGMAGSIDWSTLTEYDTAGTRTVTVPDNCDKMIVFAAAGGGGGGGNAQISSSSSMRSGAGGASGASATNKIYSVIPGTSLTIVVGTGGTSGGGNGSATTIKQGGNTISSLPGGYGAYEYSGAAGGASVSPNGQSGAHHSTFCTIQSSISSQIGAPGGSGLIGIPTFQRDWNIDGNSPKRGAGGRGGGIKDGSYALSAQAGAPGYICFAFIRKS